MKKIAALMVAFSCIIIALLFSTCKKDGSVAGQSKVNVRLKDAPAHCDKMKVHVKGFKIRLENGQTLTFPINDTIVDILQLQDTSLLLSTVNIPAGTITEVSIILGSQDTVTIGGVDYVLSLSAFDSSDYVLKINSPTLPGKTYTIIIDLNANNSLMDDGDDGYGHHRWGLKPYLQGYCRRDD